MIDRLQREQIIPCTLEQAWAFFSTPRNLDRITPGSVGFKITRLDSEEMQLGQLIGYRIKVAPLVWVDWLTEITHVEPGVSFVDEQRVGPYRYWHHRHQFFEHEAGVRMTDDVTYALPLGPLGRIAHALYVRNQLHHIFDERRRAIEGIFGAM